MRVRVAETAVQALGDPDKDSTGQPDGRPAARQMTAQVDSAVKTTASQTGSAYVSERRAFKGRTYGYIESYYLASDGEHPNAKGHQAIATLTETVIENTLHI